MGMSDKIEAFILELLKQEQEKQIRIQRNELAQLFGCVPSQINYVISTRFSPERGYFVESRRGGGGYITIKKNSVSPTAVYIGGNISAADAAKLIELLSGSAEINNQCAKIMNAAVSQSAVADDKIRANILKCMMEVI